MIRRATRLTALFIGLSIASPTVAMAQEGTEANAPEGAVRSLCAANALDDGALESCAEEVFAILQRGDVGDGEETVAERLASLIDEAVSSTDGMDVDGALESLRASFDELDLETIAGGAVAELESDTQAALDDIAASLDELDLDALVDEAVASVEAVDVAARIDEAVSSAQEFDLDAAVDDIVTEVRTTDAYAAVETGITEARNVVGAAQVFVEENPELVCDAGSVGVGSTAAAVVGLLTESPTLAFAAYRETQKAVDGACSSVLGEPVEP